MTNQAHVELGRALLDGVNAGDLSSWEAALSDDYTCSYPSFREDAGKEGAKQYNTAFLPAMPDLHFDIQRTLVNGDTCVYQFMASATQTGPLVLPSGTIPATGRRGEVPGVLLSVIKDGKIVREETYWNQMELLAQLGLLG